MRGEIPRGPREACKRAVGTVLLALRRVALNLFYYVIAVPLLFVATKLWFGYRIDRGGNELPSGGYIVVANHVHYLDSVLLALSIWPRKAVFLTDKSNAEHPVIGPFMRVFECIPTGGNLAEVRRMFRALRRVPERGRVLLVFPEGELSCYREGLAPFRPGAFETAVMAEAPVVPMVLKADPGAVGLCRLFGKAGFTVRCGSPIEIGDEGGMRARAAVLSEQARAQMEELLAKE